VQVQEEIINNGGSFVDLERNQEWRVSWIVSRIIGTNTMPTQAQASLAPIWAGFVLIAMWMR
jgi:hypothetical protein